MWPLFRSIILFTGGLIGAYHEIFVEKGERPTLLVFIATMLGVSLTARFDEKRRNQS